MHGHCWADARASAADPGGRALHGSGSRAWNSRRCSNWRPHSVRDQAPSSADLLRAVIRDESIHSEVVRLHPDETYVLSQLAEEISHSLHKLSPEASDAVRAEALRRPARWATALRLCLNTPGSATQAAIELLSEVGGEVDVRLLRTMSLREKAIRPHAAALTRRLAPPIEIVDLGTVELWIDGAPVTRRLRRKVLGLLCFVSSRPGMA